VLEPVVAEVALAHLTSSPSAVTVEAAVAELVVPDLLRTF
jgi:hypothetical protein